MNKNIPIPPEYKVYSATPFQMWTPEEEKTPPVCDVCDKKCNKIFARIFFKKDVENYCSKDCWDKRIQSE